ncbi:MAG TPA: F0F1 ATP synthase subunit delta [Candidatus Saccharimonadales bacterium]|nr:F0F1 ATP synthase subunit delta [Candidatus Saccharimonadales bacterium]
MAMRLSRRKISRHYATALVQGADSGKLALQLAAHLIETKRTKELSLIIRDITHHLSLQGIVSASVISAHELSAQTKKAIIDFVQKTTNASDVQLQEDVKPELLGGIRLKFPGHELDTTIAKRLTLLKTNYKK